MRTLIALLLLLAAAAQSGAQIGAKRPLPATKTNAPPTLDGDLSDAVWKSIEPATGFWDPQRDQHVADQTFARVAYDANFIYVAFEMRDSKPDQVTAAETQEDSRFANASNRGAETLSEDVVDVRLDPFNTGTRQGASIFSVNAIGTKSASIGGGRAKKTEWKGEWDAVVKRTATGWSVEMRIPWKILNYPSSKAAQNMGINFFRYHQRLSLPSFWSNIGPNDRGELQGIWTGVEAPAPRAPKISVLPYVITGVDDMNRPIVRTGLDARYPINSEMTAVASLNPDFGTIEGAVESVGFSRTERSVPERRPFFLEGQGFFRTGMGFDIGQFFYPRRIRTFDLGAKVYGKLNSKDSLGVLSTLTFGDRMDAVANWTHRESAYESYGVFANVKSSNTDDASVVTASYSKEWGKLAYSTRYAASNDNGENALASSNTLWYQDKNNFFFLGYSDTNDRFRLPDGLLGFTGIRGWEVFDELSYEWRTGPVRQSRSEFSYSINSNLDGSPFQRGGSAETFLGLRNGWGAGLEAMYYDFDGLIDRDLRLIVTKGWDNRFSKVAVGFGGGTIGSEGAGTYSLEVSQRVAKGFDVGYLGYFQNFSGHTQQNILTLAYEISPTRSFGSRLVTQNADTNWYLSYRDAGKKGTEWFVILGDPNARSFRQTLQVKAVFAF